MSGLEGDKGRTTFQPPAETLIGQVSAAFAIGLQTGPVRLDFTDRRFIVTSNVSPTLPPGFAAYRAWKATLPLGPYCRMVGAPYLQDLAQVWVEIPNETMSFVRAQRELGLVMDKTVSSLRLSNIRQGLQIGPGAAAKPGLPPRTPGATELFFRVPSPPEEIHASLLQTPLAGVLLPP
ncbi:MAG: hypothetical protein WCB19_04005 [Thermoplasmata archaeon]